MTTALDALRHEELLRAVSSRLVGAVELTAAELEAYWG
ncbi:hypothetical protein FHR77_000107 [Frigoribacterium endophyticum]|nr:hypothetical protein [Frigoribacterium endophyticum]